jgi:PAS domain S-box-containing protein
MNVDTFIQQVQAQNGRLAQLVVQANSTPVPQAEWLLPTAFKELGSASEELHIAIEQLIGQREELALARAAVEAERQRYQDLFDFAPNAYLVTDGAGTIREANRAAASLLNVSPEYLAGKPLAVFFSEQDRHSFRSQLNQLHQHDRLPEWIVGVCPRKGEPFNAGLTIAPVRNLEGKLVSLRICMRDISQRERATSRLESNDCDLSKDRVRHFYSKGDTIPLNPQSIWLVCQGLVKLSTVCEDGYEVLVGLAGAQMPFGSRMTSLKTYQATVLSKNVQLACIPLSEIAASPTLASALLPKINRRLQQTESLLAISGQLRVSDRLQQLLLILKQEFGQPVAQGTCLSVRLTHNDLASACCTTRVTMTRLLGKLQNQGKITFDRRSHIILKPGCFDDATEAMPSAGLPNADAA